MSGGYVLSEAKKKEMMETCEKIGDKVLKEIRDPSLWKKEKNIGTIEYKTTRYPGTSLDTAWGSIIINAPMDKAMKAALSIFKEIPKGTPKEEAQGFVLRLIPINEPEYAVHQTVVDSGAAIVKNRESMNFMRRMRKSDDLAVYANTTDGMEEEGERISGTVRMKVHEHVTIWERIDDKTTRCNIIIFSDPCGKVPAALYNGALKKQLTYLDDVKEAAEK